MLRISSEPRAAGAAALFRRRRALASSVLASALAVSGSSVAHGDDGPDIDVDLGRAAAAAGPLSDGSVLRDPSGAAAVLRTRGPAPEVTAREVDGVPAVRLSGVCRESPSVCPRAVFELAASRGLNPGRGDFSMSATLLLQPWQTSDGSNVLQKGWNRGGGGQYKLQVDGDAGRPACVLVGTGTTSTYRVVGPSSVADGAWHELGCRRAGDRLQVVVDGDVRAWTRVPASLSVRNDAVVRVGAKGLGARDVDQFQGVLGRILVDVDS